jgi:hypothetical protein
MLSELYDLNLLQIFPFTADLALTLHAPNLSEFFPIPIIQNCFILHLIVCYLQHIYILPLLSIIGNYKKFHRQLSAASSYAF